MRRNEIEAFFARRQDVWKRLDAKELAEDHTEDGLLESPLGGTVRGREAIKNIYMRWFAAFPDVEFRTEHLVIDGDKAAHITMMAGTHEGDFCGLSATGKRFEVRCVFLFVFAGGKIAREIRVYDFTGLLVQLGVLKAKPAF